MLKRSITYQSFNDEEITEEFYFNISKPELIELEVEYPKGLEGYLDDIIRAKDGKEIVKIFKHLVLMAYGVKSEDGKSFVKSDALREAFSHTAAYQALYMELAFNGDAAADWVKGVLPADMGKELEASMLKQDVADKLGTSSVPATPPTT
jgi:hypothetical protein